MTAPQVITASLPTLLAVLLLVEGALRIRRRDRDPYVPLVGALVCTVLVQGALS